MEITSKSTEKAVVVYVDGDLTTAHSPDVGAEINEILSENVSNVIINIERVNYIASTGLRIILELGKRLKEEDAELVICSMNATTRSVFDMSGFSKIFRIFDTEEDALNEL